MAPKEARERFLFARMERAPAKGRPRRAGAHRTRTRAAPL